MVDVALEILSSWVPPDTLYADSNDISVQGTHHVEAACVLGVQGRPNSVFLFCFSCGYLVKPNLLPVVRLLVEQPHDGSVGNCC